MKVTMAFAIRSAGAVRATACTVLAFGLLVAANSAFSSPAKRIFSDSSSDSLFAEGPEGSRNLVAARAEVLLGEVAESLAPTGIPAPEGVGFTLVLDTRTGRRVRVYDGEAFRRALGDIPADAEGPFVELRERAMAGALRARFPIPGTGLIALWEETGLWLTFAEEVRSPRVAEGASRKLEGSAPALARLLLAAGRREDLASLDRRLVDASVRLEALEPSPAKARRLRDAARAVRRLRGNGGASFPQEIWLTQGPAALVARIDGEIGALSLVTCAQRDGSGRAPVTDPDSRALSSSPRTSSRPPRRKGR